MLGQKQPESVAVLEAESTEGLSPQNAESILTQQVTSKLKSAI